MAYILVVDDDASVRFTIRDFLEAAGHQVIEARTGLECVEIVKKVIGLDLIIMDVIMPDKDGVETMRDLKRVRPTLKILMMSGGGRSRNLDLLDVARTLGADAILAKPFTQEQLLATLAKNLLVH